LLAEEAAKEAKEAEILAKEAEILAKEAEEKRIEEELKAKDAVKEAEKLAEEKAREAEILAQEVAKQVKKAEEKRRTEEAKAKEAEEKRKLEEEKRKLEEEKVKEAEEKRKLEEEKAKLAEKEKDEAKRLAEEERIRLDELEAERTAQQLAFENEQYNRLLTQEVQAEQDLEREARIADQRAILESAWIANIAARVRAFWRYQGAEDDWTAEVYVIQDRDGTVMAVDVRNTNVGNSSKAKAFRDSIERAVKKSSPFPAAPDEAVFQNEILFIFGVN
jgi:TolA protein